MNFTAQAGGTILGAFLLAAGSLSGCGVIYTSPDVHDGSPFGVGYGTDFDVAVVDLTYETAAAANLAPYVPARLPLAFQPGAVAAATAAIPLPDLPPVPASTARPSPRPAFVADSFPPVTTPQPYRIGVSDELLLAVNTTTSVEGLPGLINAQSKRQGYIVQDDGAIAIPDAGRVRVAGLTLQDAESEIFRALVGAGIDPSFSLEITGFNSQRVAIGGMVGTPALVPLTLKPLYLDEAIESVGGIEAPDPRVARIQIFRGGKIYQIGLERYLSEPAARHILLVDGDSIHVGSEFLEAEAERFFQEQLALRQHLFQSTTFAVQLEQLRTQREANAEQRLANARAQFRDRLELGAVERHYAYRTGEVRKPGRVPLPFERSMNLADALFDEGGMNIQYADYAGIYVIRPETDPARAGGLTAYRLDAENAVNLAVATQFQIRPNDVIFVSEQPVTSWNRALSQILPQLLLSFNNAVSNGNL